VCWAEHLALEVRECDVKRNTAFRETYCCAPTGIRLRL